MSPTWLNIGIDNGALLNWCQVKLKHIFSTSNNSHVGIQRFSILSLNRQVLMISFQLPPKHHAWQQMYQYQSINYYGKIIKYAWRYQCNREGLAWNIELARFIRLRGGIGITWEYILLGFRVYVGRSSICCISANLISIYFEYLVKKAL